MPTISGAFGYKASMRQQIQDVSSSREFFREYECSVNPSTIECPRCGERYVLVEDVNAGEDVQKQDYLFLQKSVEASHPHHMACLVVRDPEGALHDRCAELAAALEKRAA